MGRLTLDGNEAAARIAYALSDVIAIYPITPASPMGELADAWSAASVPNLWGTVPRVVEMQSEGGAAGVLHGALTAGGFATTFTASQGLLLMIPNMFKIAGELTAAVIHVAARTVATHALSIFGDHSDVMAARSTGFAMLCSASVQEAHDLALVAHAATLAGRVPFVHFFDGFRTSHELNQIEALDPAQIKAVLDDRLLAGHRHRGLTPDHPTLHGSAQNPDVFFQAREAANPFYLRLPATVQSAMDRLAGVTGRRYRLYDYVGHPAAERVVVIMGSGSAAVCEAAAALGRGGERVGVVTVRLFRPFDAAAFAAAVPASARGIAVLDRTKEPGAPGEPLYQDVVTALAEHRATMPRVIGGRYGLSSKEFTPAMAAAVFAELGRAAPRNHFTVGITDDVTFTSLAVDPALRVPHPGVVSAVFFGLGSDGTVGANKNSVKIVADSGQYAQGYFVYDSKKSGSVTVSHLRFGPAPINAPYLVDEADFVACHQFGLLRRIDILGCARPGATFLLNCSLPAGEVWDALPAEAQDAIRAKGVRLFSVDATAIAARAGLGGRTNTVLQTCFFALAGILPMPEALAAIKAAIRKTYGAMGDVVVGRNEAAVDAALAGLGAVPVPEDPAPGRPRPAVVPPAAPEFVRRVTAAMLEGRGDRLPVSALPPDGAFPTGTARWEKRALAASLPMWDPEICIDCAKCALVCPHAAIRMKVYEPAALGSAPDGFLTKPWRGKELADMAMTIQVAPDDCTGCGVCADVCPAHDRSEVRHKALTMVPAEQQRAAEQQRFAFFLQVPEMDRTRVDPFTVKGSQMLLPLFEFSGACEGCGETPYLKLISQLFGDRLVVANATGCSSIYGGNLPTTPWATDAHGRGPAWSNSLFEDNAEFGLGMRLAFDRRSARARDLVAQLAPEIGADLAAAILDAPPGAQHSEAEIAGQRGRLGDLRDRLAGLAGPLADELRVLAADLVRRSVWIVGGDGWAYDIGFGGLDHVLASGEDVNVLILDTEVYSNTGGQASKSTPRAASAKFAANGKATPKKDLGLIAMGYGNVYVAQVAIGADNPQAVRAFNEAESYPGPSLVIAYSQCIAHGIDMTRGMTHQRAAVSSGYWPLYRYDPRRPAAGEHPFALDCAAPSTGVAAFLADEGRFALLARAQPDRAAHLAALLQDDVSARWRLYGQIAGIDRPAPGHL